MSEPDSVETPNRDPCVLLEWDSRFFGFPMARVSGKGLSAETAAAVDAWCGKYGVRCVYLLLDAGRAEDARVAAATGFRTTAVRMTFGAALDRESLKTISGVPLRPAEPDDLPALERMAGSAFQHSRFYFDGRFPTGLCDELYRTWVRRSCDGWADRVLVAEGTHGPSGFVTCHLDRDAGEGDIGLIGVDRASQMRRVKPSAAWLGNIARHNAIAGLG